MDNPSFLSQHELDNNSSLISYNWLQQNLYGSNHAVLDATYFLPRQQRDAQAEFDANHIPGAQFFDIDEIADHSNRVV